MADSTPSSLSRATDRPSLSDIVTGQLAAILAGTCDLTLEQIANVANPEEAEILTGLLLLHEDLAFQREQAQRAREEREATARATLRQSEQRFELVMDQSHALLWLLDHNGRIRSRVARDAAGQLVEDDDRDPDLLTDLFPSDDPIVLAVRDARHGQMRTLDWRWNGRAYLATLSPYVWTKDEPVGTAILAIDVTAQRELEMQAQQANRLESVGRLAGGIAHDFNNLLTVIKNCAHLLEGQRRSSEDEDIYQHLHAATDRAADLVQQLLALGRRQLRSPEVVHINDWVRAFAEMGTGLLPSGIDVEVDTDPACESVLVDPTQLRQVLHSVLENARDAMVDEGQCTLATRRWQLGTPGAPSGLDLRPGDYVEISVTDTGSGMVESVRERAFEPFFTTKEVADGHGLGLSSAYGIIKQTHGAIDLQSEPETGTTVRIFLPSADVMAERNEPSKKRDSQERAVSILFVEDELQVRRITERILHSHGHAVATAASAQEALTLCSRWTQPPDVLITDVVMPGMSGVALAEHLRARWPRLPIIFVTGFAEEVGPLGDASCLIEKPYSPGELLRRIVELASDPSAVT